METNDRYDIKFLPAALNDMTEIISYFIMVGSKQGAKRIRDKMIKASEQIQFHPFSGVTVPDDSLEKSGYRMIIVEKYLMFYKIFEEDKQIIFYRVIDGKRNYPMLFSKIYNDIDEELPE